MDTILLTGATGYLGSRVASALDAAGAAFTTLGTKLEGITPKSLHHPIVVHCAGALRNKGDRLHAANVTGMQHLLRGLSRPARVIYVSTRSVYPLAGHHPVDENTAPAPWDAYGETKLAAETLLTESGHDFVIFRASALFGHPTRSGTFPDFALDHACASRPVHVAIPDRVEDYLDVDHMASVIVSACGPGAHWGKVINISGPARSLTGMIETMADRCKDQTGNTVDIRLAEIPVPRYPLLDHGRLTALFPSMHQAADDTIFTRMLRGRLGETAAATR
jgi:nucleoside-diphosphate-sugar epimerase